MTESNPGSANVVVLLKSIDIADKALTIAKEAGGNRVEYHTNSSA